MLRAIILAGGDGLRFKSEIPKQFVSLEGKTLVEYVLEACLKAQSVESVVLVCNKKYMEQMEKIICNIKNIKNKKIEIIMGGETRIGSTLIGFKYCSDANELVMLDASRPLIAAQHIDELAHDMKEGNADFGFYFTKINESLFSRDATGVIHGVDRTQYMIVQTPCVFTHESVIDIIANAKRGTCSDNRDILSFLSPSKKCVARESILPNIKVTHPEDIAIAKIFLGGRK